MKKYTRLIKELLLAAKHAFSNFYMTFYMYSQLALLHFRNVKEIPLNKQETLRVNLRQDIVEMAIKKNGNNSGPHPWDMKNNFHPYLDSEQPYSAGVRTKEKEMEDYKDALKHMGIKEQ